MTYNRAGIGRLQNRINAAQLDSGLNGWEMGFLDSILAKIGGASDQFGLSARQHHRLEQLFQKVEAA